MSFGLNRWRISNGSPLSANLVDTLIAGLLAVTLVGLTLESRARYGAVAFLTLWFFVRRSARGRGPTPLAQAIALLCLLGLASGVGFANEPRLALEWALPVLVALAVFVFVALGPVKTHQIEASMAVALVALAVAALILWIRDYWVWQSTLAAVDSTLSWAQRLPVTLIRASGGLNSNHLAFVCEIGLCIGVVQSSGRGSTQRLWRWAAWLLAGVLLLTASRGGWAGGLVGSSIAMLLSRQSKSPPWRRPFSKSTVAMAMVGLCSLGVILASGSRPAWLFRGSLGDRVPALGIGWQMFLDNVFTGHGPGAFSLLLDAYTDDLTYGGWERALWSHAHNSYVQSLLEYGLVGWALFVTAGVVLLVASLRSLRTSDAKIRAPAVAFVAAVSAMAVHSLVDVVTVATGALSLLAIVAGLVVRGQLAPWRIPAGGVLAPIALLLVPTLVALTTPGRTAYEGGLREASAGDWLAASLMFERAAGLDPIPGYQLTASQAALASGQQSGPELLDRLITDAERYPTYAPAQLNLMIAAEAIDPEGAHAVVREVGHRIVADELALFQVGLVLDRLGHYEEADVTYYRALRINPWLLSSSVWDYVDDGARRRSRLQSRLLQELPCETVEALVLTGNATNQALENGLSCPVGSVGYLHALMGDERWLELGGLVETGLGTHPDDFILFRLQGEVLAARGDVPAARRSWIIAGLLGDFYSLVRTIESYEGASVPHQVLTLANTTVDRRSPVRLIFGGQPEYVLGRGRYAVIHQREGLPSPVVEAGWTDLTTDIHQRMIDALAVVGEPG